MIIRTENEGRLNFSIVEATADIGVNSVTWQDIKSEIGVGKFFEKVAFRKLKGGERDVEFFSKLDDFLEEVWEHQYGLSLSKIASRLG
jgi:hypothetical protein